MYYLAGEYASEILPKIAGFGIRMDLGLTDSIYLLLSLRPVFDASFVAGEGTSQLSFEPDLLEG
jgi:hypothetical protein